MYLSIFKRFIVYFFLVSDRLKNLRHIVLMLEHLYSQNGSYKHIEYILFNVSEVDSVVSSSISVE